MTDIPSKTPPLSPRRYPAIPEPQPKVESLVQSIQALKESVELLTGQLKDKDLAAATWRDLKYRGIELTSVESAKLAASAGGLIGDKGSASPEGSTTSESGVSEGQMPAGGSVGQVMYKTDDEDYASDWRTLNAADVSDLGPWSTGTNLGEATGTLAPARIADGSLSIDKTSGLQAALDALQADIDTKIGEAPIDGNKYARKDGGWVLA